uniref:Uncharacterized protein n=1 Tax=Timema douglasi TaxID=61478 RepID=A0A7R8Z3W8_TIMDO|nr:unnamed protein product [Timema douglasi]
MFQFDMSVSKPLIDALAAYLGQLHTNPIRTKCISRNLDIQYYFSQHPYSKDDSKSINPAIKKLEPPSSWDPPPLPQDHLRASGKPFKEKKPSKPNKDSNLDLLITGKPD